MSEIHNDLDNEAYHYDNVPFAIVGSITAVSLLVTTFFVISNLK